MQQYVTVHYVQILSLHSNDFMQIHIAGKNKTYVSLSVVPDVVVKQ